MYLGGLVALDAVSSISCGFKSTLFSLLITLRSGSFKLVKSHRLDAVALASAKESLL